MRRVSTGVWLAALGLGLCLVVGPAGLAAPAPPPPAARQAAVTTPPALPAAPADALHQAERSVVRVVTLSLDATDGPIRMDTGSGFVVAPGKVVTNHHVVEGAPGAVKIAVFVIPDVEVGGASERVAVSQSWTEADLALLDAPQLKAPVMTIASVVPGKDATVHALGYPGVADEVRDLQIQQILQPAEPYVTPGSVALFSSIAPGGQKVDTIFHTAPINPGNSGGPLIDACGRVIGVNTWGAGAEVSADGEISTPQGQFIATRSSVLLKFLTFAGIRTTPSSQPCTPAADQMLQDRLALDETHIAGLQDQLAKSDAARKTQAGDLRKEIRKLSTTVTIAAAAILILLAAVLLLGIRSRRRA